MKSVRMEFLRFGDDTGVLQKGLQYLVTTEAKPPRQLTMPLNQVDFLDRLVDLRYREEITEEQRKAALQELAGVVTAILEPPEVPADVDGVQLDLVTTARELWALPFEAALAPDGQPLFAREAPCVVLTRRVQEEFAEHQPTWPARPRVLFAYATPKWAGGRVPHSEHKQALLDALQPWVEPIPGQPPAFGQETTVLTTCAEATLADIEREFRQAAEEGKPYTHVHLLAHGIEIAEPGRPHRKRFGIALHSDDERGTEPEALVRALRPTGAADGAAQQMPVVVTLAACDGGNAENTILGASGLAQELHRAGVPIVVASQLPLTFEGSEIMTRVFYQAWMAGRDVRSALHQTRVALHESQEAGHDWVSLVAYVRLPQGYNEYLYEIRLQSQLAALETASRHANHLLEQNITDSGQYDHVTDRLQRRVGQLEQLLDELGTATRKPKREVMEENAGLLASAHKRLAELLACRADADPARHEHWLSESRAAVVKARDAYLAAFGPNPSHHWSGVQYLALDAVLNGRISSVPHWHTCYVAATAQRNHPPREQDRIWALGSLAELSLLAFLAPELAAFTDDAAAALTDLRVRVEADPRLFTVLSPVDSTRRQLLRYVNWWTKNHGFFVDRENDLAEEAGKLVQLLEP